MTNNTINASLVIKANTEQARAELERLQRKAVEAGRLIAEKTGGRGAAGAGAANAAAERSSAATARAEAEEAARAQRRLDREAADAARNARRQRDAEERTARRERIAQEQAVTREVRAQTNQQKQAYRQLPAQITDITTSIASGMPLWMVAIQQGGQIKDSFGGMGAAAKGLLSVLTPLVLAVGGVAAALAAVGLAAFAGYKQQDALNKQIALTGNIAGTSLGQVDAQARRISESTGAAIGGVRDTLAALLQTGNYTSANLEGAGRAVTALRKLTGQSAEEAVASFEAQGDGITAWALKANRAYNFLTVEQLAYVRRLESEGRTAEAVRLVNEELAGSLEQRSVPAVGSLQRAMAGLLAVLSGVWDALKGIGREETAEARLARLRAQLATLDGRQDLRRRGLLRDGRGESVDQADRERTNAEIEAINRDQLRQAERAAALRTAQEEARKQSRQYQDALAAVDEAGARKRLAIIEAGLDAEAHAVERADNTGLQRAEDKALKLNAIEQRRLAAQAALLERQIAIESNRKSERERGHGRRCPQRAGCAAGRGPCACAEGQGQRDDPGRDAAWWLAGRQDVIGRIEG